MSTFNPNPLFSGLSNGLVGVYDPWRDPIRCPVILYTILVVIGLILNLSSTSKIKTDRLGREIPETRRSCATILGIIIYLVVAYLFGVWMYNLCVQGSRMSAWLVFLLAIFFPFILSIIILVIIFAILGVSSSFSFFR